MINFTIQTFLAALAAGIEKALAGKYRIMNY